MPSSPSPRSGFTFLLLVLAVGIIALMVSINLIQTSVSVQDASLYQKDWLQAFENAWSCSDYALSTLRRDPNYLGSESLPLKQGNCTIEQILGTGYSNRTVCVNGISGDVTRHLEIAIDRLFPTIILSLERESSTAISSICTP